MKKFTETDETEKGNFAIVLMIVLPRSWNKIAEYGRPYQGYIGEGRGSCPQAPVVLPCPKKTLSRFLYW